ncbi:MAG TPA: metal ABC transporter permease [Myxococcales bacterium]|nr:metal ABC transporter permease [Myxococcales bacterium]
MQSLDPRALGLALAMAVAAGLVGSFAVMRRMTLAADAMSHVALPGIGLALIFKLQPVVGGVAMLLLGTLLIWALERGTRLSTETIVGVVFSAALAAGSLLASGEELIDALFGGAGKLAPWESAAGLAVAAAIVAFVLLEKDRLIVSLVSPDIARTAGIDVARLDLLFLAAFSLTVALGLRYLGVLLMGSLIIIPGATAKRLARSLHGMLQISVALAVGATALGFVAAALLHRETGPLVILCSASFFFLSLPFRRTA